MFLLITSKFIVILMMLLPSMSLGAVATDVFSNARSLSGGLGAGNTTLTFSHVNTASVTGLAVAVYVACGSGQTSPTVSGVTYAGTSLSSITSVSPDVARRGYLFGWPSGSAPTTGTNNIVVTLASSLLTACDSAATLSAIGMSVTGSDTTSQYVTSNTNSGSGTTASLTVSSNPTGAMGFSTGCSGNGITSSTEGAIDVTDTDTGNSCGTSFGMDVAPTDASWSFTIPSDSWMTAGLVFAAPGGGGGATAHSLMLMGVGQ